MRAALGGYVNVSDDGVINLVEGRDRKIIVAVLRGVPYCFTAGIYGVLLIDIKINVLAERIPMLKCCMRSITKYMTRCTILQT